MGNNCNKTLFILLAILIASVILNVVQYYDLHNMETKTTIVEKHDTITVCDTLYIESPKPAEVIKTKEYIKVPVEVIKNDTVFVELEKTEKTYKDDSTYECKISGVEPNLDYIKVFPKTTIITNEKVITNTITKKSHFNWGIQTGLGYGVINKKLDVFVGMGAQYNF